MKKFLLTFFILLIFVGVCFFMGWAQFTVPPGAYGVIISKTHGIDHQLVKSGEFRWIWYKLVPTNVKIPVFHLEKAKFPISYTGSFSSTDVYSETVFASLPKLNFAWDLKGEISFRLNPDNLLYIVERKNIHDQEALDEYLLEISRKINNAVVASFSTADSSRVENILLGKPDERMEQEIIASFPEITDFFIDIHRIELPDFEYYRAIRQLYEDDMRKLVADWFDSRAKNLIQLQLLRQIGEALREYPELQKLDAEQILQFINNDR